MDINNSFADMMKNFDYNSLNIPQYDMRSYRTDLLKDNFMEETLKQADEAAKRREEYNQDVLNTLKGIEKNTASLNNIIELIRNSNENQETIINIINELLLLSKENNIEEAESKFKGILSKITSLAEGADTITKLITFATTIRTILQANGIMI